MPLERFVNNGTTSVATAYSAGNLSLTVLDASRLPTLSGGDQYSVVVFTPSAPSNAEILRVTSVTGNVLTVVPADEEIGGVQSSFDHPEGDTVANELSVDSLTNFINGLLSGASAGNFVWNEVPLGVVDGVNDTFVLSNPPLAGGKLLLHLNGLLLRPGASNDYTLSSATITFNSSLLPGGEDSLTAFYVY